MQTENTPTGSERRAAVIYTLEQFIRSRPGLEYTNYGDATAYRAESRSITRDRDHALTLLAAVSWRQSISADDIINAARHAFSGRLSITEREDGKVQLDYCAGQYYPTEYRRAACAVLSSVLWDYWRGCDPTAATGGSIRKTARRELPRAVASRWFN